MDRLTCDDLAIRDVVAIVAGEVGEAGRFNRSKNLTRVRSAIKYFDSE